MNQLPAAVIKPKWFGLPRSGLAQSSVWLVLTFLLLMAIFMIYIRLPHGPRPTFFSDPISALLLIAAAVTGTGSGMTAVLSIILKREKSLLLIPIIFLGAFVALFAIGELLGGD